MSRASRMLNELTTNVVYKYKYKGLEKGLKSVVKSMYKITKPPKRGSTKFKDNHLFVNNNISDIISNSKPPSFKKSDNAIYFYVLKNNSVCYIGWDNDLSNPIWTDQLGAPVKKSKKLSYPDNVFIGQEKTIATLAHLGSRPRHNVIPSDIIFIKEKVIEQVTNGDIRVFALKVKPIVHIDDLGHLCKYLYYLKCGRYPLLNYV